MGCVYCDWFTFWLWGLVLLFCLPVDCDFGLVCFVSCFWVVGLLLI